MHQIPLEQGGYTREEVVEELHRSGRKVWYRYELLDRDNQHASWIDDNVIKCNIANNMFADVKRIGTLDINARLPLEVTTQRVRPWFCLEISKKVDSARTVDWSTLQNEWSRLDTTWGSFSSEVTYEADTLMWPLGVFMLGSPKTDLNSEGLATHRIELYDQMLLLRDWRMEDRYSLPEGKNVVQAVKDILQVAGIPRVSISGSDEVLPRVKEWAIGASMAEIVNELLDAINYNSLSFSSEGVAYSHPYERPDDRATDYTYQTDRRSILFPAATYEFDWVGVANHWIGVVSNPDLDEPLVSTYTNDNPDSPLSTVALGRVVTDFRDDIEVVSQEALDGYIQRLAFEASQIYQRVEMETLNMPMHQNSDMIRVNYPALNNTAARFVETEWEMDLEPGGTMKHKLRKLMAL